MVIEASKLDAVKNEKIDEVDKILANMDGKIVRKEIVCRHPASQRCTNCLPLDPYDEGYLKEKDIKHLSFHAYVRKLTDLHGKGTRLKKPLENINCKLQLNCTSGHKPYPKGICTKCRPPTLTLNRQRYRHVDNITFENDVVCNRFLNYWRYSSCQRVGFLIGRYEPFVEVPLGIRAVVSAIYEPPQISEQDLCKLEIDPNSELVDKLCQRLGMKRIGWIFTDLWSADSKAGTVHCLRHEDSFLLTASECITAGKFQSEYKNYTDYSYEGVYGSKFVTVVASGDKTQQINLCGYQVSNQCTAMVEADIICPVKNQPELAWVREKPLHEKHYITDVQFTEKDEYGAEVRRDGRPMPVEYLMVDVPAGLAKNPTNSFAQQENDFPVENRVLIGQTQNLKSAGEFLKQFLLPDQFPELINNFHFLLYLLTNEDVKFEEESILELAKFIGEKNGEKAMEWCKTNVNWLTFVELIKSHADATAPSLNKATEEGNREDTWACLHCTFENTERRADCAMCGLPA